MERTWSLGTYIKSQEPVHCKNVAIKKMQTEFDAGINLQEAQGSEALQNIDHQHNGRKEPGQLHFYDEKLVEGKQRTDLLLIPVNASGYSSTEREH